MNNTQKIIFSNSYSPRTGHNFAAEVFKVFTNHQVLIHNKSETRLATMLESYYKIYNAHIYHKTDRDFFDYLFINDLRQKILSKSEADVVMIKDTSFLGVSHLKKVFPDDIHILLIRDPRDVLVSLFGGMRLGTPTFKNYLKRMATPIGIYPFYYSLKFNNKVLKLIPNLSSFHIVRFEDLVLKDKETLLRLKNLFQSTKSIEQIQHEIDQIKVINTSFIKETNAKNIWDAKPKTAAFTPVSRKAKTKFMEWGILLGSRKLRKKLNYI